MNNHFYNVCLDVKNLPRASIVSTVICGSFAPTYRTFTKPCLSVIVVNTANLIMVHLINFKDLLTVKILKMHV